MTSAARIVRVLGLALAALPLVACGGKKKGSGASGAGTSEVPQDPPEPDGIRRYRGVTIGRELMPVHAMDPKEATNVWHYRVEWLGGRVVKMEHVSPGAGVTEAVLVEYKPDGSRVEHVRNAYGIEVRSDAVERTGIVTRTWRSGEQIYDGCFVRRRTFDSFSRMETDTCLDDKSAVVTDADGCAVIRYQYTVNNDVQTRVCLNTDMTPAYDADGVHRTVYDRDIWGLVTDESFFGFKNEPVPRLSDGCVRVQTRRDDAGNARETICADDKGQSAYVRGAAWTTIVATFDANGCATERKYVDHEGKPPKKGNLGSESITVDKACGVLSRVTKDPRGRPVSFGPGRPPQEIFELGPDGLWTKRTCKGAVGPVACVDPRRVGPRGSIVQVERDEHGRVVRERCFQAEDKPSPCEGGYPHEHRYEYGADGRPKAEKFFDEKGAPALGLGAAQVERKYTSIGKKQMESYLDKDGQPILNKLGFASITFGYDVQQRVSLIQLQGVDGQPRASRSLIYAGIPWPSGAAKMSVERELDGKLANVFLSADDKVLKRVECVDLTTPCYRR